MSKKKRSDGVRISDLLVEEVHNMGDEMKIVKVGIELSNQRMQVLEEICKIREDTLRLYIHKAVVNQIDLDLETPNDLGLDYCKHLKKILNPETQP
jgi:hypothetical protein